MMTDRILCGDCIETLNGLPENSLDLTVFSPPYDGIRDYKKNTGWVCRECGGITRDILALGWHHWSGDEG